MTQQNLKEKVAVITGAARNMGRAFAETLGSEGATVAVHYHSTSAKTEAKETASAVNSAGGKAFIIQADLTVMSPYY